MTKPLHRARSESHRTCALILTSDWRLRRRLDTVARRRVRRRRGRGGRPRGQGRLWSRRARPRSTPPRARAHARAPCTKNSYDVHETVQRAKCQFWPCTVIGFSRHPLPPQRLEKIPPGFGLVGIIIRDRNNFSARDKRPATSKQQSGVRSRRTSCPRSSSSRVNGTRRGAGSATCSRWRTSGARSSSSGSLTGRCTWHSASSRTCAKIRQRRQHQGQAPGA